MCSEAEKEEEERGKRDTESACVMWYLMLGDSYQISLVFHAETLLFEALSYISDSYIIGH